MNTSATLVFLPGMLNTPDLYAEHESYLQNTYSIFHADTYHFDTMEHMASHALDQTQGSLILVGVSMGGYCALEMYSQCPSRILGMVLFNTSASPSTSGNIILRENMIKRVQTGRFLGNSNAVLNMVLGSEKRNDITIRKRLKHMGEDLGRDVYINQQRAIISRSDTRPILANSDVPCLCIAGGEDRITAPEELYSIAVNKQNAEYHVLESAGHLCPLEFPEKCEKILKDWFRTYFAVDL